MPFFALVAIGITLLGFSLGLRVSDPIGVNVVIRYAHVSNDDLRLVTGLIADLSSDTRFAGRTTLNEKPRSDHLNLYVFSAERLSTIDRRFNIYKENCAYTGWLNVILCDLDLIDGFLTDRALDRETASIGEDLPVDQPRPTKEIERERLQELRRAMLLWVLGHEIGHAVAGHAPAHFQKSQFHRLVDVNSLSHQQEIEADQFVIDRLAQPHTKNVFFYFDFLTALLNRDIRMRLCPDIDPLQHCPNLQQGVGIIFNSELAMTYSAEGTHPEYLIRLLRMIDVADDRHDLGIHGYLAKQIIEYLLVREVDTPAT